MSIYIISDGVPEPDPEQFTVSLSTDNVLVSIEEETAVVIIFEGRETGRQKETWDVKSRRKHILTEKTAYSSYFVSLKRSYNPFRFLKLSTSGQLFFFLAIFVC